MNHPHQSKINNYRHEWQLILWSCSDEIGTNKFICLNWGGIWCISKNLVNLFNRWCKSWLFWSWGTWFCWRCCLWISWRGLRRCIFSTNLWCYRGLWITELGLYLRFWGWFSLRRCICFLWRRRNRSYPLCKLFSSWWCLIFSPCRRTDRRLSWPRSLEQLKLVPWRWGLLTCRRRRSRRRWGPPRNCSTPCGGAPASGRSCPCGGWVGRAKLRQVTKELSL